MMSSDPTSSKFDVEQAKQDGVHAPPSSLDLQEDAVVLGAHPRMRFSLFHWATHGVVRLLYRGWTRIAVRLFPEDSKSERVARQLHIPLPDTLNMSWVNEQLAVGGRVRSEDIAVLGRIGVTHIVDTRAEHCDDEKALASVGIELLYLPAPDTYPLSVAQLMQGADWAQEKIQQGGRVLIHCEHGVGRSVLLTCAVLVRGGMHARDALELVEQKRWQAAPNHRQVSRLRDFESSLDALRNA